MERTTTRATFLKHSVTFTGLAFAGPALLALGNPRRPAPRPPATARSSRSATDTSPSRRDSRTRSCGRKAT